MIERVFFYYLIELYIMNGGFVYINKFDFKINFEKNIILKILSNKFVYLFICFEFEFILFEGNFE